MQEVLAQARAWRDQLLELMERDARSYDAVMAAYQLPKDTAEQKERRTAAIQEGLQGATLVPMQTLEACVEVLRLATVVVEKGNLNAVSDGGAGVLSAYAGMLTAAINVRINLNAIKDTAFVQEMEAKMEALVAEGEAARARAWQILQTKLGLEI
jgi:formiminotetrahydrofolate cyclodeaminase